MPGSPRFDERHLQDVVLAQSEEIRPVSRFSGLQALTRPAVALTAIVAIVAIGLGIKDYVGQQNLSAPAGAATPAVEHTKAITRPKKSTSGKTERTRTSATEAAAEETAQAATAADEMQKPVMSVGSADPDGKQTIAMENQPNTLSAEAARDERETAIGLDNRAPNETIAGPGSSACLPLPNGTLPGDVDADYYFGWATEYCGRDLSGTSAPSKVPKTQPSKR